MPPVIKVKLHPRDIHPLSCRLNWKACILMMLKNEEMPFSRDKSSYTFSPPERPISTRFS